MKIFKFIKHLIFNNIGKTISLTLSMILLFLVNSGILEKKFVDNFNYTDKFLFSEKNYGIYIDLQNKKNLEIDNLNSLILSDNGSKIEFYSPNDLYYITYGIIVILFAVIIIGTFSSDSEANWGFRESLLYIRLISIECICEYVDGEEIYFYILGKRLIVKSNLQLNNYELSNSLREFSINKKKFPIYKPPSERRNHIIEEIIN